MVEYPVQGPDRAAKRPGESGFVLVVVLLITAVLVAVVVEFAYSVYLATARSGNFMNGQKAALLAGRGAEFAGAALDDMLKRSPYLTIEKGGLVFMESEGEMTITIRIVDEKGKVSLRTVFEQNGVKNDKVYDEYSRLLENLGVKDSSALEGTLADWIDSDDEPRLYGAEAADYISEYNRAYKPANAYIDCVDDLLMIKGYGPKVFAMVSPFVSANNENGLVNINTAPKEVLMALSGDMTEELVDGIIDARAKAPFRNTGDLLKVKGFETLGFGLQSSITVESDTFRIYTSVASGEIERRAEAIYRTGKGFIYWREM